MRLTVIRRDQLDELIEIAKQDPAFWGDIKKREQEIEGGLAEAARLNLYGGEYDDFVSSQQRRPPLPDLIKSLVRRKCGIDHNLDTLPLIVEIRTRARIELGLPI